MTIRVFFLCLLGLCTGVLQAAVLEGVGHANIREGNLAQARAEARQAAMRDLALQYEARVSTTDTIENGELTQSYTELSAQAKVRNATIVDEYRRGNLLRVIVRADMAGADASDESMCKAAEASGLRKRVAVTAFPVLRPVQAGSPGLNDAAQELPRALVARLQARYSMEVLGATSLQLFSNLPDAPTAQANPASNHLTNVVQLARELGAQFVVSGVIRDISLADPGAWGSSIADRIKRRFNRVDTRRRFAVELMIFDGFSGSPVLRQRFETLAPWQPSGSGSGGFASAGFSGTEWGRAVSGVMDDMAGAVSKALACQPFMTRITRVAGEHVTLASGATAGLRPGQELSLYRSQRYFDSLQGTPELSDTGATLVLNNVHPDFSNGRMSTEAGQVNIQRDDLAIIW
ncbi:hypothetical protein C7H09_10530 [Marinobacter fuscus]|uniref:Flagellar assembly protein T N-terminal domain-containing protein n=1 Tax=Marinobacter fuscus TaxID=2109942 RepID=A0A2T1KBS7_9GAMM|nr:flagellar assembly protein T N-terminal domain-containing protein [Marinobacter fuscus]PSF07223.1 hypothetical protein C7H09_10530 [Marinobacter fuscus]